MFQIIPQPPQLRRPGHGHPCGSLCRLSSRRRRGKELFRLWNFFIDYWKRNNSERIIIKNRNVKDDDLDCLLDYLIKPLVSIFGLFRFDYFHFDYYKSNKSERNINKNRNVNDDDLDCLLDYLIKPLWSVFGLFHFDYWKSNKSERILIKIEILMIMILIVCLITWLHPSGALTIFGLFNFWILFLFWILLLFWIS